MKALKPFQNYLKKAIKKNHLTERHHFLLSIAILNLLDWQDHLKWVIQEALKNKISKIEIEEIILQNYLFAGYPTAIEGLFCLHEIYRIPSMSSDFDSYKNYSIWKKKGIELCQTIYGDHFERLMTNINMLNLDLAEWMLVEGYGKVLSRNQLDLITRELCILAVLVIQNKPRQLRSHLRGALHVSATPEQILATLHFVSYFISPRQYREAKQLFQAAQKSLQKRR
jgi:4-carboxymuconolactone decarboxylase